MSSNNVKDSSEKELDQSSTSHMPSEVSAAASAAEVAKQGKLFSMALGNVFDFLYIYRSV